MRVTSLMIEQYNGALAATPQTPASYVYLNLPPFVFPARFSPGFQLGIPILYWADPSSLSFVTDASFIDPYNDLVNGTVQLLLPYNRSRPSNLSVVSTMYLTGDPPSSVVFPGTNFSHKDAITAVASWTNTVLKTANLTCHVTIDVVPPLANITYGPIPGEPYG